MIRVPIFKNGCTYEPLRDIDVPWLNTVKTPQFKTKGDYQSWHARTREALAPHFSLFEGLSPLARVNSANPAHRVLGVVGDYDAELSEAEILAGFARCPYRPTAWNRTRSGGIRAVWLFEKPIFYWDDAIWAQAAKILQKRLKLDTLWPGFDAEHSLKPEQTFVAGTDWHVDTAVVIWDTVMQSVCFDAVKHSRPKVTQTKIPFDVLTKRMHEQFPGRGPIELAPGVRCIRFWDPIADNPTGAFINEAGATCFTGPVPFMSWEQIFGKEFTQTYTEKHYEAIRENVYVGEKAYYTLRSDKTWVALTTDELKCHLRCNGVDSEKVKGQTASEMDRVMDVLKHDGDHKVQGAIPFALNPNRVVEWQGERYLNTATVRIMQPSGCLGTFPWLQAFFERLFPDIRTREHFFAWLRRWYKSGLAGAPQRGQALFIAGGTGTGKTFLSTQILGRVFGGYASATKFFVEGKQFNHGIFEKALWAIDDSEAITDSKAHSKFTGMVKACVANPIMPMEKKFGYAGDAPFDGRLIVTLNEDVQSLSILPDSSSSILDKVSFYRTGSAVMGPWSPEELMTELPYFLQWLNTSENAEWVEFDQRFGIKSFHDETLVESAAGNSPIHMVMQALEEYRDEAIETDKKPRVVKTLSEVVMALNGNPKYSGYFSRKVNAVYLGRVLGSLPGGKFNWVKRVRNRTNTSCLEFSKE